MDLVSPVEKLIQTIFAPSCVLCHKPGHQAMDLCLGCYQALPWNDNACINCALPLPAGLSEDLLCGRCLQQPPAYDAAFSLFRYQPPVTTLIQKLKFNEKLSIIRLMTQLIASKQGELANTECLLPVPLHNRRMRQRGFNQSIEIARPLANALDVALENNVIVRMRDTAQQTGQDAKARRKNIKGAFSQVAPLIYKKITIIDDVVTTGSTVNELARVLKKAGAEHVSVFSLARAVVG